MKPKKAISSKPKLSFTVDRSEFDINSDWVQAVMAPPSLPGREAPFFSPDINNATDVNPATVDKSVTVTVIAPVSENARTETKTEENAAPVADIATEVSYTSVEHNVADQRSTPVAINTAVADNTPGVHSHPVVESATVPRLADRAWKPRPLRRITDGLTPGQYAVYSLMLGTREKGQGGEQLYRGGYADLGRLTGMSKRGIQNVIGELQDKAVIHLHTAPGHHRMQTSAYLVPDPELVLQTWFARGWRFAVGKGKKLSDGTTVALSAIRGAA